MLFSMHNEDLNIGTVTMFDTWWKIVGEREKSLKEFSLEEKRMKLKMTDENKQTKMFLFS